ncbi:MAG TPA: methyltransferase domain-containing protein [Candidatus Dormibacteraeota bacterium]|nr:methyltransferase domain-containing protein [Candidatus Dormibacteraeota bacterium]
MSVAASTLTKQDEEQRGALVERLFRGSIAVLEMLSIYVGERLGLYRALAQDGPSTATQLARSAGIHERYAREWLEQQAVAGLLEVTTDNTDGAKREYRLALGHAEVLLDPDSLNYLVPIAWAIPGLVGTLPALFNAYRGGGGVPYKDYGPEFHKSIASLNRPMFINLLGTHWLPAMADVDRRLRTDPPARVADVGCGAGWSSIAIAQAYPKVRVDGFDIDEPSTRTARENAATAGVGDRVRFEARDAAASGTAASYDLVTAFETIHDMSDPVAALKAMRALVAPGGAVMVADERVAETFSAPGDELERFNYGWSILHCLPVGRVDPPALGTGTVMRPETLRRYARQAGFSGVEILPIEHDLWRFYRLVP